VKGIENARQRANTRDWVGKGVGRERRIAESEQPTGTRHYAAAGRSFDSEVRAGLSHRESRAVCAQHDSQRRKEGRRFAPLQMQPTNAWANNITSPNSCTEAEGQSLQLGIQEVASCFRRNSEGCRRCHLPQESLHESTLRRHYEEDASAE
jgi:hypothetical protein